MKESIDSLFCNNPDLSHRIYTYCKADPEFMEAEAESVSYTHLTLPTIRLV